MFRKKKNNNNKSIVIFNNRDIVSFIESGCGQGKAIQNEVIRDAMIKKKNSSS